MLDIEPTEAVRLDDQVSIWRAGPIGGDNRVQFLAPLGQPQARRLGELAGKLRQRQPM